MRSHSPLDIISSLTCLVDSLNRLCLSLPTSNTNRAFPMRCADTIPIAKIYWESIIHSIVDETCSNQVKYTTYSQVLRVSVLFQANVLMHCALGSSNEVDNVTDTLVTAGTSVTIRNLSGDVLLQTVVETSQGRTVLTNHIKQELVRSTYIPRMCMRLQWTQPVCIQRPAGFKLADSQMHIEATMIQAAIPAEFDFGD